MGIRRVITKVKLFITWLRRADLSVGRGSQIDLSCRFYRGGKITIGKGCDIRALASFIPAQGSIHIGDDTSIGMMSVLHGGGGIEIGSHVLTGPHVTIVSENHIYKDPDTLIRDQGLDRAKVKIENDVWIGCNVTILSGVTIGRGSVIAAGAVVTRSVSPYCVVAGVPARKIADRQ